MRSITDLAFEALDADGSGGLDSSEIAVAMEYVAKQMGVDPPTDQDLDAILM